MRMNELRRERAQVSTSDEKLRTDQRQARSDGVRNLSDQGGSTRDEMCMFIGLYYPRDRDLEQCSVKDGPQSSNATFVGNGTKTCGESVTCTTTATDSASYYGCVVDSCPANANQVSALLRCQYLALQGPDPVCKMACNGADQSACQSCVTNQCSAQLNACFSATCS